MDSLIHYAIPFFILTVILEGRFIYKKNPSAYNIKDTITSISMGLGNVVVALFFKVIEYNIFMFFYQYSLFKIDITVWTYLLLLFSEDLAYYLFHRVSHESRLFWASHVVHHSSQKYNLSTALRQTWTGGIYTSIFWIPLALIGFHPLMIVFQRSVSLLYQYWIHTETIDRLGFFEFVMNTPSHHRVHHGRNVKYLDRNHAGIFIIWDRLFGTFIEEKERPEYGLTKNIDSYNLLNIAFHEWLSIGKDILHSPNPIVAFKYIFKAPGWSHDGSRKTASELKAEQ